MKRLLIAPCLLLGLAQAGLPGVLAQDRAPKRPAAKVTTEAVLVDVVVRDKNGRTVSDLKPEEIEVFEDGAKQKIKSFELIQQEIAFEQEQRRATPTPNDAPPPITSLKHVNLVTLVFDGLAGLESRRLALQASEDFINTELHHNVVASVYVVEHRLHVIQPFTNDRKLLLDAVKRATSQGYAQYLEHSNAVRKELETYITSQDAFEVMLERVRAGGGQGQPSPDVGMMSTAYAQAKFAQMTLETLRHSEAAEREQQGQISLHALMGLVKGQQRLAGRKTILYYSEGLVVPPNWVSLFKSVVSEANRNNVSFYSIDSRGLVATDQLGTTQRAIADAAAVSRSAVERGIGEAVLASEVRASEAAQASLRMDGQGTLDDLATSTGGFLIANTNDFRESLQDIGEDLRGYYELTYTPKSMKYDGKFRVITVKVNRKNVSVQSRSGYFAVPSLGESGPTVQPFETPLLAVLHNPTLPGELDYRSQLLRFRSGPAGTQYTMVVEIPMENTVFVEVPGEDGNTKYATRLGLLALFKDDSGQVIDKVSQDYPLTNIPVDRAAAMQRGNVVFVRQLELPPGRLTVESVVQEEQTARAGARRVVLVVPRSAQGLQISSVMLIRRIDKATPEDQQAGNPLVFREGKIVPSIGQPFGTGPNAVLPLYVVAYPAPGGEPAKLTLSLLQNGVAMAQGNVDLPTPDSDGRIPYIAQLPLANIKPGEYEVRATVTQGQQSAEERTLVTLK